MRVFVVWERVIASDIAPPGTRAMARISDDRVSQYWDPERALSDAFLDAAAEPGHPWHEEASGITIVWDFVAHYAPGVRWDDAPPLPDFHGYPIVDVEDELRSVLAGRPAAGDARDPSPPGEASSFPR